VTILKTRVSRNSWRFKCDFSILGRLLYRPRMEKSHLECHELLFPCTAKLNYPASAGLNNEKSRKRRDRGVSSVISPFLGGKDSCHFRRFFLCGRSVRCHQAEWPCSDQVDAFIHGTWLIHTWDMNSIDHAGNTTYPSVTWPIHIYPDSCNSCILPPRYIINVCVTVMRVNRLAHLCQDPFTDFDTHAYCCKRDLMYHH